jgi:3-hydroxyisobutyrate dehydrogenase
MAKVGFIGLGNMGLPMALNLVKAGHAVAGNDVTPKGVEALTAAGGTAAKSLADAAEAEIVITMLPAGQQVREVYLGASGILSKAKAGTLFIDSSTIDVESARAVAVEAEKRGMLMIDAPVSGGVGGAQGATLTFMAGGPAAAFEKAKPFLEKMGKTIVHAGGAGAGQAAKICNNMILGISMIAVSEAFVLAEKLGLDKQKLFDISSKSSGQCWSMTSYCPVPGPVPASPANNGYKAGFAAALMLKDLKLAKEAAQSVQANTALGAQAAEIYQDFARKGQSGADFSAIINLVRGQP